MAKAPLPGTAPEVKQHVIPAVIVLAVVLLASPVMLPWMPFTMYLYAVAALVALCTLITYAGRRK